MKGPFYNLRNNVGMNVLQEVREENKRLKIEIDVHSATMENLRKGYICLEVGFRTLHDNYAAQLESARADIREKNRTISELNAENTILLKNLNAIKKGKYVKKKIKHYVKNACWMNCQRSAESGIIKNKEQKNDDVNLQKDGQEAIQVIKSDKVGKV